NDTSSSSRIRDNQRRSRTRRAALLSDLQKRVHEYEQQGVTATQDMQRAARKVAQDNVRLRSLLALHGVQQEEVESYLRSPEEAIIAEAHLPSLLWSMANHQRGTSETNSSLFLNSAENDQYLSSPGLEISCETAATIIAEMRGDGDKDSVRASLGCRGREGCNIKNTTVLQVMEESWG
ncbi:hypothetical protein BKA66DRAFT_418546, partial [Pyrenochaeta sp. MPI-SDFR-AT-0127]